MSGFYSLIRTLIIYFQFRIAFFKLWETKLLNLYKKFQTSVYLSVSVAILTETQ